MQVDKSQGKAGVLCPWADVDPIKLKGLSPRLPTLKNQKIGLFRNIKSAARPMLATIQKLLKEQFPDLQFSWYTPPHKYRMGVLQIESDNKDELENWLKGVDAVIAAIGDSNSPTRYLAYDAVTFEEKRKPTIMVCTKEYFIDARSAAASQGMPALRIVPESVLPECSDENQIYAILTNSGTIKDVIAALTAPLSEAEQNPQPNKTEESPIFEYEGNIKVLNGSFYRRGWTDGLPIIPPTEEAVREMMAGVDLPPEHVVGKFPPRLGKATVEKIAVNAVMAGALPIFMPVFVAGVQAIIDKHTDFGVFGVSTGSWAPFWSINGPIRKQIGLNCSTGALSPGDIANATIGRTMSLIIKNIGGVRKGIEDMGSFGNPGKYSLVLGENEEESPWEPFHVERGYQKDDNTLTVFFPNEFSQVSPYTIDEKGLMRGIVYNIQPGRKGQGLNCVLMNPYHARLLSERGWTKNNVKEFISENATAPFYKRPEYWVDFSELSATDNRKKYPVDSQEPMRLMPDPKKIMIIVTGGQGAFISILRGSGFDNLRGAGVESGGWSTEFVTKKIDLPKDWNNLVAKYESIKPEYLLY
jgi:hypothetical protein